MSHTFRVLYIRYELRSEDPFSQTQKGSFVVVSGLVAIVKVIGSLPGLLTISNAKEPGLEPPPVRVEIADPLLMKKRYQKIRYKSGYFRNDFKVRSSISHLRQFIRPEAEKIAMSVFKKELALHMGRPTTLSKGKNVNIVATLMKEKPWVIQPGRNGPYSQYNRGSNLFEIETRFYYEYYVRGAKRSVSLICIDIDNKSIHDKV